MKKISDELVVNMYVNEKMSIPAIAEEFSTYANKIRRILVKNGIKIRSRSEAQALAIKNGRATMPEWDDAEEVKKKISEKLSESWQNLSDKQRKKRSDTAKKQWEGMSESEKRKLRNAAHEALRKSAKEGSKLEKFIRQGLTQDNFDLQYHYKGIVGTTQLELDFFLPKLGVVIEIDGPSHFMPVWGEDALKKTQYADAKKAGIILAQGYVLIRLKFLSRCNSQRTFRQALESLVTELHKIKKKFPPKSKRFIEIEVQ